MQINDPFNPQEALAALLPGKVCLNYRDDWKEKTVALVDWACDDCPQDTIPDIYLDNYHLFPRPEGMVTANADTLHFTDDSGRQYILQSLENHRMTGAENGDFHCGRFEGVDMSLALFAKRGGKWLLEKFAPSLGCYGEFQTLPKIKLIRLGRNNFGCYIIDYDGGPGGPFWGDLSLFALYEDNFRKLLSVKGVSKESGGGGNYVMKIVAQTDTQQFENLQLKIQGNYIGDSSARPNEYPNDAPPELWTAAATTNKIGFKITRSYKFKNGSYYLAGKSIRIKK